jgi:DNA/RNA endonuclease YhcR with UshA esterase domain
MSRFRFSLIAGALVALAACDEAAAPKGTPGDLQVRAYVDRDASGTYDADVDSALAGLEIAVSSTGTDGTQASATTDATGIATFADLAPGSYTVTTTGGMPTGAVLTSNPAPTIAVSFQGTISGNPDFRFAFFPGTVTGRIFRDDDASGGFTTGDAVGAGLTVHLRSDAAGQAGDTIATTVTDNAGVFTFSLLAPGDYWVELENPTTISYGAAGALRKVTVAPQGSIAVPGVFTGSLVVTIAEATAKPIGAPIAVIGNVTVAGGQITSSSGSISEIWVQDATGGIAVFPVPSADSAKYRLGQRVQVSGTRQANGAAAQIGNNANVPALSQLTGGTVVAPIPQTGAQVVARAAEGRLVTLSGFKVTTVGSASSTTGAYTVTGTTPDGQSVQVRVTGPVTLTINGTPTTIPNNNIPRSTFVVGNTYSITGIETQFNGTSQIKTRQPSDVSAAPVATPAHVVINEFMANPAAVGDNVGEYIELHNNGGTDQNLQGWIISDNFGVDTIDVALVIPAGGYVLLGVNADRAVNGNIPVDFQYVSTIALGNSGDRIQLRDPANVTVDSVAYASSAQAAAGVAWGVIDANAENATVASGSNWVAQSTVYNTVGTTTDKGTPRARNDGAVSALLAPSSTATSRAPDGAKSNRR